MRKSPIEISDRKYVRSHGMKPKGRARWWFLVMDDCMSPPREHDLIMTPVNMTLSDAKVWARAAARERFAAELETGHLYLEVAP